MYSHKERLLMASLGAVLILSYYASKAVLGESLILKIFFGTLLLITSAISSKKQLGL
ncbi:hypothetical protein GKQ38_05315 [Candidatus Nanohaloarchaea archaeon]|nr:hypothetical protein GKQ38_05315 [Candidatus Nanohaloarchaea archaeon]